MKTRLLWILTRTPLHVGAGSSVGAIDMPVARERHTQIPIVPGSGLKGVLRDLWNGDTEDQVALFGTESSADDLRPGALVVGEARATCFPVRSAKGSFAWLTSPLTLGRLARERGATLPAIDLAGDEHCLAGPDIRINDQVVLEEYCLQASELDPGVAALVQDAFDDDLWRSLPNRLALVTDGIFSHFCANACEVQQRIRIDDDSGTVAKGGLFNQENVPSETLFCAVVGERESGAIARLADRLDVEGNVLQIGGDETVGLGYCSVRLTQEEN